MTDAIFMIGAVLFFILCDLYAQGCARI